MILSIIVPCYRDRYLQKTLDSLLANSELGENVEIIVVLDGFWPDPPIESEDRLIILHRSTNMGMREAINSGVSMSRGKYIMKIDSHCMVAQGYDRILTENIDSDWVVTPRRYYLDPILWQVMDMPPVDYMKLGIAPYRNRGKKFSGYPWNRPSRSELIIDEIMAFQGSCWIMNRTLWSKAIQRLETDAYGKMGQESHEISFKVWKAGGKIMVNKATWYAHKHRKFNRTHKHGGEIADRCFAYSLDKWKNYYLKEIRPRQKEMEIHEYGAAAS